MKQHVAVGLTGALAVVGMLGQSVPAQADPTPSSAVGAEWVSAELDEYGLFQYPSFDSIDYGVNIDAGTALLWGGDRAGAAALRDDIEPGIDEYITGEAFDDTGSTYANPLAKTLAFVVRSEGDWRDFDGVDLPERLDAQVNPQGRIFDTSEFGDNANMIGQAFAAQGLHESGASSKAGSVLSFLLDQQCSDGHFPLSFSTESEPDPCAEVAGVDVTALVAMALRTQAYAPAVNGAIRRASAWVADQQNADGSIPGAPPTTDPNANTTGLGASLLGAACDLGPANRAAAWTRALQVTAANAAGTQLPGEVGAVAYDQAAFDDGAANGIGTTTAERDQWRRATVQAVVGLNWDSGAAPSVSLRGPSGFQKAGAKATYRVHGETQYHPICFVGPGGNRMLASTAVSVTYPGVTRTVRYGATTGPGLASLVVKVLAPKRLAPTVRSSVRAGRSQLVRVSGLAAGESVRVVYGSRLVATGKANSAGRFAKYFRVGASTGTRAVTIRGQYNTREGSATFRVVR